MHKLHLLDTDFDDSKYEANWVWSWVWNEVSGITDVPASNRERTSLWVWANFVQKMYKITDILNSFRSVTFLWPISRVRYSTKLRIASMCDEKVLHAQWTVNWYWMWLYFMPWVWLSRGRKVNASENVRYFGQKNGENEVIGLKTTNELNATAANAWHTRNTPREREWEMNEDERELARAFQIKMHSKSVLWCAMCCAMLCCAVFVIYGYHANMIHSCKIYGWANERNRIRKTDSRKR